jgi:benzoate 1,2-dioxygenase, alpha subunit
VHWNYAATQNQRKQREAGDEIKTMSAGCLGQAGGGFYSFDHGHLLLWTRWANPEDRPAFERREQLAADFGQARADWMIENSRNLCLYPNVYLMDQFSSQIRIARPISVNKTEITIYCIAPKGESADARAKRIRQYEDFFNVSGMATPDDLEEFRSCQTGYGGGTAGTTCPVARSTGSKGPMRPPGKSNSSRCCRAYVPRTKACSCCSTSTGRTP